MKDTDNTVEEINRHIVEWENDSGNLNKWSYDHPAVKCKLLVLRFVSATKSELTNLTAYEPLRQMIQKEVAKEGPNLCDRAVTVTRAIADAPNQAARLEFRSKFERLYWAELYWVELEEKERRLDGRSRLESAMVRFRREGLKEWKTDDISMTMLDKLASEVQSRCDKLFPSDGSH